MQRFAKIGAILAILFGIYFFLTYEPALPRETPFRLSAPVPMAEIAISTQGEVPFLGLGAADFDGDGTPEIFVGGDGQSLDRLLRAQVRGRSPIIVDISGQAGVSVQKAGSTYGFTPADVDDDGDIDFYLTRRDGVVLYTNTTPPNLTGEPQPPSFTITRLDLPLPAGAIPVGVAVGDLNRNGQPDLAVSLWPAGAASLDDPLADAPATLGPRLFIDDTAGGFIDSTSQVGLPTNRSATGLSFADMNNDQVVDLVATYQDGSVVIIENQGDLRFQARPIPAGLGYIAAMQLADINGDGLLDIVTVGQGEGDIGSGVSSGQRSAWSTLVNRGDFVFQESADGLGLVSEQRGTSLALPDLDSDGRPDVVAGVADEGWEMLAFFPLPSGNANPIYYKSEGAAQEVTPNRYNRETELANLPEEGTGTAVLAADLFGDGSEDLVLVPRQGAVSVVLSTTPASQLVNFVKVRTSLSPAAIGSRVELSVTANSRGLQQQDYSLTRHVISNAVGPNSALPLNFGTDSPTFAGVSLYSTEGSRRVDGRTVPGRVRATREFASQSLIVLE